MATGSKFELKYMDRLINNLNKEVRAIERRSTKGLVEAGKFLYERMEPKIPVDSGNLRSSWFIVSGKGAETSVPSFVNKPDRMDAERMSSDHTRSLRMYQQEAVQQRNPMIVLGFSAYYAKAVHEMVDATFKRPGAQARFMYSTMQQNLDRAVSIIAENSRIR